MNVAQGSQKESKGSPITFKCLLLGNTPQILLLKLADPYTLDTRVAFLTLERTKTAPAPGRIMKLRGPSWVAMLKVREARVTANNRITANMCSHSAFASAICIDANS